MIRRIAFIFLGIISSALFAQEVSYHCQGKKGIVAASEKAPVEAGLDMLRMGGNAADAAVSVILAETVVDYPRFNIGCEVIFMYYDAKSKQVKVLSGLGEAPLSKEGIDWYKASGSFFTKEDLASHVTEVEDAVTINYRGYSVYKTNTWTQGPVMLQALRLIENFGWGSNAGPGGSTGVTHGTRLESFNTLKGHPNCIEPGKRPRVTLSPTIVLKDGNPVLAMSAEGGDTQDQNQVNIGHPAIIYFDQKTKMGYSATDPSTARFTGALK